MTGLLARMRARRANTAKEATALDEAAAWIAPLIDLPGHRHPYTDAIEHARQRIVERSAT
ncbi:hypothetical protein ACFSKW_54795 [Nonomuraea mangrovi]|uniref:Uncharacterized protein n=1 Tax=Nonomuraea mangrovi TaxID=2316207 RepID=A0ABW4TID9_9ACTN